MKNLNYLTFAVATIFAFSSCNNDDDSAAVNEEEVITTITTTLTNPSGEITTFTSRDLDGDGPNAPVVTVSGTLSTSTSYTGEVTFLNEIANPPEDITAEVLEEGVDHQVFFQAPIAIGDFTYTDTDSNGNPIGLSFTLYTGTTSGANGNLFVTLIHLPNKSASGVTEGIIDNAGGETDGVGQYPIEIVD